MTVSTFQDALEKTADGIAQSLYTHMPDSPHRDYYLWALSNKNPQRDAWLQTMGVTQLVELTLRLYDGLVDPVFLDQLVEFSIPINIYQMYEIISDNLGIGLAARAEDDITFSLRQKILHFFNRSMVRRLTGNPMHGQELLQPIQPMAEQISLFDQSLSGDKLRKYTASFLNSHNKPLHELEYAVWYDLVGNIESCRDVVHLTAHHKLGPVIAEGLASRYRAVNTLLENKRLPLNQRIEVSTDAILVSPILAYFISGMMEIAHSDNELTKVVEDGSLVEGLYICALLIRMLNDLGTNLVMQSAGERAQFMTQLEAHARPEHTMTQLLRETIENFDSLLGRLDKDITHREFNLGIHDLDEMDSLQDALDEFQHRLAYYAGLYEYNRFRLKVVLRELTARLGNDVPSRVIDRCLRFHEHLYTFSYRVPEGEYAI